MGEKFPMAENWTEIESLKRDNVPVLKKFPYTPATSCGRYTTRGGRPSLTQMVENWTAIENLKRQKQSVLEKFPYNPVDVMQALRDSRRASRAPRTGSRCPNTQSGS